MSNWFFALMHELVLHGKAVRHFPYIGKTTFISAGSLGDFIMIFPDGTKWSSTEHAERASKFNSL